MIRSKNYCVKTEQECNKGEQKMFTAEEIEILWDNVDKVEFVDMILIGIYSGWRPKELVTLKVEDINLDEDIMFGGLKMDDGKNRCVPIHPLIKELVIKRYNEAQGLGSEYLFNDLNYNKYLRRFNKVVEKLKLGKHHPNETRHTFIIKAIMAKMDKASLRKIAGRSDRDISDNMITHRGIGELKEAMAIVTR